MTSAESDLSQQTSHAHQKSNTMGDYVSQTNIIIPQNPNGNHSRNSFVEGSQRFSQTQNNPAAPLMNPGGYKMKLDNSHNNTISILNNNFVVPPDQMSQAPPSQLL